jgi:hypothetical protein
MRLQSIQGGEAANDAAGRAPVIAQDRCCAAIEGDVFLVDAERPRRWTCRSIVTKAAAT